MFHVSDFLVRPRGNMRHFAWLILQAVLHACGLSELKDLMNVLILYQYYLKIRL